MKKIISAALMAAMFSPVMAKTVWVSDEIEAPLRQSPELNAKIVSMLPAGQKITSLEKKKDFIKIKTSDGKVGWLSNYYILRSESVHAQLAPVKKSLEKSKTEMSRLAQLLKEKEETISQLQSEVDSTKKTAGEVAERAESSQTDIQKLSKENTLLKETLAEQNSKMEQLATALEAAKEKATDAQARYLSLAKISENAVDIDAQNQALQKKAVQFEQDLQRVTAEKLSLESQISNKKFVIGVLTVLGGILVGYILSILMPPSGRRRTGSNSGF